MALGSAVLLALAVAVSMEAVAWAPRKYVIHGVLRVLHKDHHQGFGKGEARAFGFLYAPPSYDVRNG